MRTFRTGLLGIALSLALVGCGGGRESGIVQGVSTLASNALAVIGVQAVQRLTVTAPSGGRVFSVPAGIDCGATCAADLPEGSTVSLRAIPATGYAFDGWEGSCSDPTACSVTLNAARTVTARFVAVDPRTACTVTRSTAATPRFPSTHPRLLLANAELKDCLQRQMAFNSPAARRMKDYVDAQMAGGNLYGFEPWFAALVYQATGDTRYADYAVQRTDAWVAGEEALIAAGQRAEVAYDSYLYVGDLIGGLSVVYDWAYDRMTPQQRQRWIAYANQAVWNVWNPTQARWGSVSWPWSGWSVDNPVNNYYHHFLRATMFLGLATRGANPQADAWITRFRTEKLQNQLFPLFNSQLQGGGSREGTGYGTSFRTLWELYDWWERSTGERIATLTPHTRDSIAHFLHNITPTLDRLAPTGDHARDASAALFDYHRHYLLALIALFPQDRLAAIARDALQRSTLPRMRYSYDYFADFIYGLPSLPDASLSELSTAYWGAGTGQLPMRSGWSTDATFANFICGPFTESHAHRDQGSFVLFRNEWLAWDANIVSSSGLEQGEENHNLVRVFRADGSAVLQRAETQPCQMLALAHTATYTYAVADVTPVYNGDATLQRQQREFLFIRPSTFVVMDRVTTSGGGARKVWTLNLPAQPELTPGRMRLNAAAGNSLDVFGLAPANATGTWVNGSRVEVSDSTAGQSHFLHVLGANGGVAQAVRDDANGLIGTRVTLGDGRSALVRFNAGGAGGTLELRAADGSLLETGALPTGVSAPPLYATDAPPPPPPPPAPVLVTVTSPSNGSSFTAPASFEVAATATPETSLTRVELWRNGVKVAEDASSPYSFAQSGLPAGSYQYEARAVRADGVVSASPAISVTVTDPAPPPASVALTSPASGSSSALGTPLTLDAGVTGSVTLTRMEYLANGSVVASRAASPWSASWTPPAAGSWTLQARATLSDGREISSATATVTVADAPPPPPGNPVVIRQGASGYAGATDVGVSNQYIQYNNGKGVVTNDAVSGVYKLSGTGGYEVRSFLRFAGLNTLQGKRVTRAELSLTFNWGATGQSLTGRYLARAWDSGASGFGWTRRNNTAKWAQPGSGGADWVSGKSFVVNGFTGAAADTRTVALDTAMVQSWIDKPSTNQGLVLVPATSDAVTWLRTSEDGNPDYRPTLRLWLE